MIETIIVESVDSRKRGRVKACMFILSVMFEVMCLDSLFAIPVFFGDEAATYIDTLAVCLDDASQLGMGGCELDADTTTQSSTSESFCEESIKNGEFHTHAIWHDHDHDLEGLRLKCLHTTETEKQVLRNPYDVNPIIQQVVIR